MIKYLVMVLISLITPCAFAEKDDVELAKEAREFLSRPENEAGFKSAIMCKKDLSLKIVCDDTLTAFDVVLAIKKPGDETFTTVRVEGVGPMKCRSKTVGFITGCITNKKGETNGSNTPYKILEPKGYVVYANRRPTEIPSGFKEAAYTAYGEEFDTPSVREQGKEYIQDVVRKAREELRDLGVMSALDGRTLVSEHFCPRVVTMIATIEHIDPFDLFRSDFVTLLNRVYTILGLNREIAYMHSPRRKVAHGMFQIIPSTYRFIRE
jgi:hypothetical protein